MSGKDTMLLQRRKSVRDELLQKARDLFGLCDTEDKGFATKRDMLKLQGQLSLSPEQLGEVFDALDKDGNGYLTLDEFKDGFGMFLGIDSDTWNNMDQNKHTVDVKDDETDAESDDEQFEEFLDQLGAQNLFRDEDYIRQMWGQVKKHDPLMVNNFEDFLGKITRELKKSKTEYSTLESTLKNRSNLHDQQVQSLYMEMEEQLQKEKEQLLAQERKKEKKVKDEMESELYLKDQQLQELLVQHAEMEKQLEELNSADLGTKNENAKLQKERDTLELRLEASEKMLDNMKKHLDELRRRSLEERRKRAQAALKVSEGIALERENLVNQLQFLQQVNKRLLDEKDELMLSASNSPFCRSPETTSSCCGHVSESSEDSKLQIDDCNSARISPSHQNQQDNNQFPSHAAKILSRSQTSLEPDNETVVSWLPEGTPTDAAEEQEIFSRTERVKTSTPTPPLTSESVSGLADQHPLCPKCEDDYEVDDSFFENNPQFFGIPNDGLSSLHNLNLSTGKEINKVDMQNIGSGFSSVVTMQKQRRKSSGSQSRKSSSSHQARHPSIRASTSSSSSNSKGTQADVKSPERVFKVVFVGDSGVGKTSFIHRFCNETFRPTFNATIGMDFQVKTLQVQDRLIALQLWDTAGQERFRSLTKQYFRKADGIVVVYDVTSETSFKNVRNWTAQIKEGTDEQVAMMLIGNKLDLCEDDNDRVIKTKDGSWLADEFGCLFFETSAKTGKAVEEAVCSLSCLLQEKEDEVIEKVLQLQETIKQKKKCC